MDWCRIDISEELGRYVATERDGRSIANSIYHRERSCGHQELINHVESRLGRGDLAGKTKIWQKVSNGSSGALEVPRKRRRPA